MKYDQAYRGMMDKFAEAGLSEKELAAGTAILWSQLPNEKRAALADQLVEFMEKAGVSIPSVPTTGSVSTATPLLSTRQPVPNLFHTSEEPVVNTIKSHPNPLPMQESESIKMAQGTVAGRPMVDQAGNFLPIDNNPPQAPQADVPVPDSMLPNQGQPRPQAPTQSGNLVSSVLRSAGTGIQDAMKREFSIPGILDKGVNSVANWGGEKARIAQQPSIDARLAAQQQAMEGYKGVIDYGDKKLRTLASDAKGAITGAASGIGGMVDPSTPRGQVGLGMMALPLIRALFSGNFSGMGGSMLMMFLLNMLVGGKLSGLLSGLGQKKPDQTGGASQTGGANPQAGGMAQQTATPAAAATTSSGTVPKAQSPTVSTAPVTPATPAAKPNAPATANRQ